MGVFSWLFGCKQPIDTAAIVTELRALQAGQQQQQTQLLTQLLDASGQRRQSQAEIARLARCSGTYPNR